MVERIEPKLVDLEPLQRPVRRLRIDRARTFDRREIANTAQQPSRDTGRPARPARNLVGTVRRDREAQHPGGAPDNAFKLGNLVKVETDGNAETIAQRRRQKAGARCRPDQRERCEFDADGARARSFADNEVQLEILHRGIEDFLDGGRETMNLIDEKNIARLEIGEEGGEIACPGNDGARRRAEIDTEFARNDLRQRRLAETGRPGKQHMIERLGACPRGLDEDGEIFARPRLAGEIGKTLRPQRALQLVFFLLFGTEQPVVHRASSFRPCRINCSAPAASSRLFAAAETALMACACG